MTLPDPISRPLEVVAALFQQAGCPTAAAGPVCDFGAQDFFAQACGEEFSRVPRLDFANVAALPNRSLVRLQGMVQDLPNPEVYLGVARLADGSLATTKYSDGLLTPLAQQAAGQPQPQQQGGGLGWYGGKYEQVALWDRRPMVLTQPPYSPWVLQGQGAGGAAGARGAQGVRVYMYDRQGSDLMLHDLAEVVGVLCREEADDGQQQQVDQLNSELAQRCSVSGQGPASGTGTRAIAGMQGSTPSSQVVRIHAIFATKLNSPVALATPVAAAPTPLTSIGGQGVAELRRGALELLGRALGGDMLAAEYVLMLSLQRVTGRPGDAAPMGIGALNLTHCPPSGGDAQQQQLGAFAGGLLQVLQSLLPLAAGLPLTVPSCNDPSPGPWAPRPSPDPSSFSLDPDFASPADASGPGGLGAGCCSPLQLPPGTLLVVDETVMSEGRLEGPGVANLQALAKMTRDQVLEYDFEVYKHPVPVSVPTLVVSTGRSLLREAVQVQVPLHATAPHFPLSPSALGEALAGAEAAGQLAPLRAYLATAGQLPYELGEAAKRMLVDEFVRLRQRDGAFGAEQFQAQLTLARAYALSHGEIELVASRWEQLQQLEATRQARLRVV